MEILAPHMVKMNDHNREMEAGRVTGKAHRITCPYCTVGAALVVVNDLSGGQKQIPTEPVQCENCSKYFKLKVRVVLLGEPLPI